MNALPAGGTPRSGSSRWPPGPVTVGFRWPCRRWRTWSPWTRASTSLSDVAGAVIDRLLRDVLDREHERHGAVPGGGCAVVARGRLGAREMIFGSDLDLLVVADFEAEARSAGPQPIEARIFYRQAAAELISGLRSPSTYGRLYELDERLRPSGEIEPPVTTIDEFRDHHAGAASTSELMSLTRASVVCGDPATADAVTAEIRRALSRSRDPGRLLDDVARRREAIAAEHPSEDPFDVQHVRGGLVDLESLAQYLRLRHAHESPEVLVGATAACFEALGGAGIIPEDEASLLAGAVRMQRTIQAMLRLTVEPGASGPRRPGTDAPEAGDRPGVYRTRRAGCEAARDAAGIVRDLSATCRCRQPAATSNAVTLRVSRLNSTPIRWIGSPPPRYLAA